MALFFRLYAWQLRQSQQVESVRLEVIDQKTQWESIDFHSNTQSSGCCFYMCWIFLPNMNVTYRLQHWGLAAKQ